MQTDEEGALVERRAHSEPVALHSRARTMAEIGIFLILAFAAIALSRNFLMPLTMAVLLFFVFAPFRRFMTRRGIPQPVSAALVTAALLAAVAGIVMMLLGPAGDLIQSAPDLSIELERKFESLKGQVKNLQEIADKIDRVTDTDDSTTRIEAESSEPNLVMRVLSSTPELAGQLLFVLVLLFFMISTGDLLYLKIVQSFGSMSTKRQAYKALRQIEQSLGSYFGTIAVINACLGLSLGVAMWIWGMPAPAFFGVAGFLLNFIPYIGLLVGAVMVTAVALVSMDGFFGPVMVGLTYILISSVEGQLITPYFVSRRLQMNTVVVFISVALWAWLWSIVGMIVAVPMLVVLRVLCDHIPGMERFGNFLSGEDPAPLDDNTETTGQDDGGDDSLPPRAASVATDGLG